MATLLVLIWGFSVFFTPFVLLVTAYYAYFHGLELGEIALRLIGAFIGYFIITAFSVPLYFVIVFAGAHSEIGLSLDFKGFILYSVITFLYVGFCYLLISLVKGGFVKPWKLLAWENTKEISIFESNGI